ncbi:DUF421 domain-containing protein [Virgibacillus sp. FSP13]
MGETLVVAVRAIIAFFTLLIFTRILGKQQVSQLTFFDYILGITIGSIAASLTTDLTSRSWPLWVGLFMWALLVYIFQWITLKGHRFSKYIDGEPTVVIMNGKIMEDVMKKIRYRADDLMEQLRGKGVFDINEIEFAVLETNGKLSILKKSQYQNVTPKDLNISVSYKGMSTELIYDGRVIEENLQQVDRDKSWLENQVKAHGLESFSDVFLAIINSSGQLFIDGYRDSIRNLTDISDYDDLE